MTRLIFILVWTLATSVFLSAAHGQTTPQPDPHQVREQVDKAFAAANDLMEQHKPAEALVKYKEALTLAPDSTGLLFNAGLAAYLSGNFGDAAELWKRLKELEPLDWQARAKLVQAYQALGRIAERDAERAGLFELRKSGKSPQLAEQARYCREQFEVNGRKLMVFEHFELKGEYALRYVFSVLDQSGKAEDYRISLGSYESTNAFWRESKKPAPRPGERLFHLDGYFKDAHATYGMFSPEPSYEETRALVVKILEEKIKPVSGTTFAPAEKPKP
jgi:tetratricopeptide (TPR) repeat protein